MKYSIMILLALSISTSCTNKQEDGLKKSVNQETNQKNGSLDSTQTTAVDGVTTFEQTYGYIAYNGKRASVTFKKNKKENTINILSNGRTFNLDYQKDTDNGQLFSRNGIEAETKGDSLYIRSGSTIIELAKVK